MPVLLVLVKLGDGPGTLTIPAHALYFSGYESSKGFLGRHFADGPLTNFLSGFWADVMGSLIWTPMDVVKQRLQVSDRSVHCVIP